MFGSVIFILLLAFNSSSQNAESPDLGTVIFANVIFRHGDRTPEDPYPNDPYRNESSWTVPFGQLTNIGKHQQLMLGRYLRQRYDHILPKAYSRYDIHVQSTDVDRTLMSAECNLAGIYPPVGEQVWDEIKWMPIPVHTVPEDQDYILAGKKYCPKYNREFKTIRTSGEISRINRQNEKLYSFLTEKSGEKIHDLTSLNYLYNTLYIEELKNKTLPDWTKSVYPEKMQPYAEMSFELQAYNEILQRLKTGPLIGEMVKNMVQKSKGILSPDRKLFIYSGHDTTVANVLMTLGLFEKHCPPYTATILIELRLNSKKQHVVTVSYKNTSEEPSVLTLPGCIAACPLNQFVKLTKKIIPENWDEECSLDWMERYKYERDARVVVSILTASTLMLAFLGLLFVGFTYWHYKRYHQYHMSYLINID